MSFGLGRALGRRGNRNEHRSHQRPGDRGAASTRPASSPTSSPRRSRRASTRTSSALISAKKNEPECLLEWRLKAYRHWLTMKEPTWPNVHYPPIDYQAIVYYSAPKQKKDAPKSLDEVDPELLETYEKLGIPLRERAKLAGVAVDAVFDSVSVATTFKEQARGGGHHLLLVLRGGAEASRARARSTSARSCPTPTTSSRRSTPRSSPTARSATSRRACAARWSCRTYFRINAANTGPVRAHADRRRGGRVRQLPRGLHRARCATRTSCTPRWSSWSRSTTRRSSTRPCRTGTRATRKARAASTTSSPSAASAGAAARRSRGRRSRPARPSPGSTRAASCRATTRSASSTRWR